MSQISSKSGPGTSTQNLKQLKRISPKSLKVHDDNDNEHRVIAKVKLFKCDWKEKRVLYYTTYLTFYSDFYVQNNILFSLFPFLKYAPLNSLWILWTYMLTYDLLTKLNTQPSLNFPWKS